MSVITNNLLLTGGGAEGYQISRSVRTRASASAYFNRTPASATNRRTWTWSGWVKRGSLSTANNQYLFSAVPTASVRDAILFNTSSGLSVFANDASSAWLVTTQVFRDPSAWYHIVVAVDTTQATSSNRIKVYLNGTQITSFSTATYPTQNYDWGVNNNVRHTIGDDAANAPTGLYHFDGYQTEVNFIDGQALTPSSFGETDTITGVWKPKAFSGTYGTNGFYLNFSDNSAATAAAIGKDSSGNGNNWTPNNISVTSGVTYDSMLDVPTLSATASNHCVWNAVAAYSGSFLSSGNLDFANNSGTHRSAIATIGASSGKWYWEMSNVTNGNCGISSNASTTSSFLGDTAAGYGFVYDGNRYNNGSSTSGYVTYSSSDVLGFALDMDAGTLTIYKNGASPVTGVTGLTGTWFPATGRTGQTSSSVNFGQRPFSSTPPTGFKALNTYNLPDSTITNGAAYMAATTYTGNLTGQSITNTASGASFQPDLVWIKSRSAATDHKLTDSVRGVTNALISNTTGAETTDLTGVTAINSNGFTVGASTVYNNTGVTYVGWQWKAGGSAVSNTSGSITSSVSAGATQGFSVVTYTGTGANATVGHGLGVAPKMIITKPRNSADNWISWHTSLGATGYIYLNLINASATAATVWNSTLPTSTVFSIGTSSNINSSGQTQVAYCFSEVAGYSKFGSYTGNGSADGTFVYLGFRPKFVLFKRTDSLASWGMHDASRDTYNEVGKTLYPDGSSAEDASTRIMDFLSNGFKCRQNNADSNASGATYIYAAFAENPTKYALAR
jgi:hypothetical protein